LKGSNTKLALVFADVLTNSESDDNDLSLINADPGYFKMSTTDMYMNHNRQHMINVTNNYSVTFENHDPYFLDQNNNFNTIGCTELLKL
jgi:hypothetical protein